MLTFQTVIHQLIHAGFSLIGSFHKTDVFRIQRIIETLGKLPDTSTHTVASVEM